MDVADLCPRVQIYRITLKKNKKTKALKSAGEQFQRKLCPVI